MFCQLQLRENIVMLYICFKQPLALLVVLFSLEQNCSKRMRRLVSVGAFYILGGGYIAYGKEGKCIAFP